MNKGVRTSNRNKLIVMDIFYSQKNCFTEKKWEERNGLHACYKKCTLSYTDGVWLAQ